jgi:hypothetical protein
MELFGEKITRAIRGLYMTKQMETDRAIKTPRKIGNELPAPLVNRAKTMKIAIASVQYAGTIATVKGDVPSWRITFSLDAEHVLGTSLTVQAIGATDVMEAQQTALLILQGFAQELLEAARNFS